MSAGAQAAGEVPRQAWVFGRGIDLWIGCGLVYLVSVPVLWGLSASTGVGAWPAVVVIAFLHLVNAPHYGATIVRVYERRDDRRAYAIFAVWITLALIALLAVATHSTWIASLVITAYVTWSPWHFSGQNYGLACMFARRHGLAFDATTQRWLYVSFVASAGLTIVSLHAGGAGSVFAPSTLQTPGAPSVLSPDVPRSLVAGVLGVAALVYVGATLTALFRLRVAGAQRLLPVLCLVATQALWFAVPPLLYATPQDKARTLVLASIWVSTVHSAQYLWISTYYANRADPPHSVPSFLWKAFAAGSAVTVVPAVLFSPRLLGGLPWDVGLAAVVFSIVNLHHFILDGAIWKLRDGRVARVLLRAREAGAATAASASEAGGWGRSLGWALAAAMVLIPFYEYSWETRMTSERKVAAMESGLDSLGWLGRESVRTRLRLARRLEKAGLPAPAVETYEKANQLFSTSLAYAGIGNAELSRKRYPEAAAAYARALELEPDVVPAMYGRAVALGWVVRTEAGTADQLEEAIELLEGVLTLEPDHPRAPGLLTTLQRRRDRGAARS